MRKLASIQKINDIREIPGADKVVMGTVRGWEVVVGKNDFQKNDLGVYFECDSLLSEKPEFEFLRSVKFRVKIRRFKGQISMGLMMPLTILPKGTKIEEGLDVTELLEVKNYVKMKEDAEELSTIDSVNNKSRSKTLKFLMQFAWFRWIYLKLNRVQKGNWPQWEGCSKSDEERVQNCAKLIVDHFDEEWYISEKCDGKSFSSFLHRSVKWGFPYWLFGICSRNLYLKTPDNSDYWRATKKYDLENKLRAMNTEIFLQAELIGEKIQANKYKRNELEIYVFTIVENGKRVSLERMREICNKFEINTVPILDTCFIPSKHIQSKEIQDIVKYMIEKSIGKSELYDTKREGIVMRLKSNPYVSLKIINPEFLLAEKD
jgi:hypothetical protein